MLLIFISAISSYRERYVYYDDYFIFATLCYACQGDDTPLLLRTVQRHAALRDKRRRRYARADAIIAMRL